MANSGLNHASDGRSFKEMRKIWSSISDLQKVIDQHFNLPCVRIRQTRRGGLYLVGLFDGVLDDVESQGHESFDEINKLLGWIEGDFELPELPKSAAPKVFEESSLSFEEIPDPRVDESKAPIDESGQISPNFVHLDEVRGSDVLKVDVKSDGLLVTKLKFDDVLISDGKTAQFELGLNAHDLLDEMSVVNVGHGISSDVPEPHKSVSEIYVNLVACLEVHYFDPGGEFVFDDSSIANLNELANDLNNRGFIVDPSDVKTTNLFNTRSGFKREICIDSGGFNLHLGWHVKRDLKHVKFRFRTEKVDFYCQLGFYLKLGQTGIAEVTIKRVVVDPGKLFLTLVDLHLCFPMGDLHWVYDRFLVLVVPTSIFTLGGGYLYGLILGFDADSVGSTIGSVVAFLLGRTIGRPYVLSKVQDYLKFRVVLIAILKFGFKIVLTLRLVPLLPYNLLNYLLSVTPIPLGHYMLASWLGMMPMTMLLVYAGTTLKNLSDISAHDYAMSLRNLTTNYYLHNLSVGSRRKINQHFHTTYCQTYLANLFCKLGLYMIWSIINLDLRMKSFDQVRVRLTASQKGTSSFGILCLIIVVVGDSLYEESKLHIVKGGPSCGYLKEIIGNCGICCDLYDLKVGDNRVRILQLRCSLWIEVNQSSVVTQIDARRKGSMPSTFDIGKGTWKILCFHLGGIFFSLLEDDLAVGKESVLFQVSWSCESFLTQMEYFLGWEMSSVILIFDPGGNFLYLSNIRALMFEIILEDKDVLGRKYCNR